MIGKKFLRQFSAFVIFGISAVNLLDCPTRDKCTTVKVYPLRSPTIKDYPLRNDEPGDDSFPVKALAPLGLPHSMDQVVKLLLPTEKAAEYIKQHPSHNFRFYVYDNLPKELSWKHLSRCIENKWNVPKEDNETSSNCDWGASVCTEEQASPRKRYSTRRFNRNADTVLSKAFLEYEGPLRTRDPNQADAFIVPYPASAHCACHNDIARCFSIKDHKIKSLVIDSLKFLNETSKTKHVFFSSSQAEINHPFMLKLPLLVTVEPNRKKCPLGKNCGHIAIPYANTNTDYQPNAVHAHHKMPFHKRKYALGSAIVRKKVHGANKQVRALFVEEAARYLQNGTNNTSRQSRERREGADEEGTFADEGSDFDEEGPSRWARSTV